MKLEGQLAVIAQAKRRRCKTPHTSTGFLSEKTPCLEEKCCGMLLKIHQVATVGGDKLVRKAPGG